MDQKKFEVLKKIKEFRDKKILSDFGALEREGFDNELLRAMVDEGLLGSLGTTFHLTIEGEEVLRDYLQLEKTEDKFDNFAKLIKINEEQIKFILEQQTIFSEAFKQLKGLESWAVEITKQQEYLSKMFSGTYNNIFSALSNINLKGAKKFKEEFDWLDFLSLGFALELGDLLQKDGRGKVFEKLNELLRGKDFENYLSEELERKKFLKSRKEIIIQGYLTHKSNDYVSSISILFPQIEGIIWDIGVDEKIVAPNENSCKIIDCNGKVIKRISGNKDIEWDLWNLMLHLFGDKDPQKRFYKEEFYKNERNPLLHGRKLNFGLVNSVTALLLIFGLIEKIKDVETKNEN